MQARVSYFRTAIDQLESEMNLVKFGPLSCSVGTSLAAQIGVVLGFRQICFTLIWPEVATPVSLVSAAWSQITRARHFSSGACHA